MGSLLLVVFWAPVPACGWAGGRSCRTGAAVQWIVGEPSAASRTWPISRCLLKGYRVSDLTVVYPVARGTGPLISSLAAVAVLGEAMTLHGAAGVLCVCVGVFIIAGGPPCCAPRTTPSGAHACTPACAGARPRAC